MSAVSKLLGRYRATSDPLKTERRVELVAIVLIGLLALQLVYGGMRVATQSLPPAHKVAPDSLKVTRVEGAERVTAEERNEITSRPLFWPSRRPVALVQPIATEQTQQAAAAAKAGDLGKVKLLGTFGGGDSGGVIAVVDGKKERILLTEKAMEWTLESIGPDRAVFSHSGQSQEVMLAHAPLPAAAGITVAPEQKPADPDNKVDKSTQSKKTNNAAEVDPNGIKSFGVVNSKNAGKSRAKKEPKKS